MSSFIELTTKRFLEASNVNYKDEFRFIVGNKEIACHKFIAAFLSNRVSQMLISDPTANYFKIHVYPEKIKESILVNNEQTSITEDNFIKILQYLIFGEQIEITADDIQQITYFESIQNISKINDLTTTKIYSILQIAESLENEEIKQQLYSLIFSFLGLESKNEDELKSKLNKLFQYEKFISLFGIFNANNETNFNKKESFIINFQKICSVEYNKLIKEIAQNFTIIDDSMIAEINDIILEDVLSSPFLQLKNEDSLLNFLLDRRSRIQKIESKSDKDFFFQYVEFQFLTENGIKRFLNEVDFNEINTQIWNQIIKRLELPVQIKNFENSRYKQKMSQNSSSFSYDDKNPFNGILKHLTDISKGNIQINKTIEITCSNLCCGKLESLVDFNTKNFTHVSEGGKPFWLQINFKTRKIQIDSYLIKMCGNGGSDRFLKSWKIEISQWK